MPSILPDVKSNDDATTPARLRVALDASFLHLPPSGIGTYVRCLLDAMPDAAQDIDLIAVEPDWRDDSESGSGPIGRLTADPRARRFLWDLHGVATAARSLTPDVLHVPQLAAPLRPPAPLVVTVHDAIPFLLADYRQSRAMRINLATMRRTVRRADRVIAPSRAAAEEIADAIGIDRGQITVVPLAPAPELAPGDAVAARHVVVQRFGVHGDYVFNIAGFDRRKNLPVLIEAFARALPHLDRPLTLVIGGAPHSDNPNIFPDPRPLIHQLGLNATVVFTGKVTDEERRSLYQGAAAYATPSLHEGFGLTALEAMVCGVPTIVSDRTSLPEVVGDAALVVPPTAEAVAHSLVAVLTNPSECQRLRAAGIARARTFSWNRTASETATVYRQVTSESRTR